MQERTDLILEKLERFRGMGIFGSAYRDESTPYTNPEQFGEAAITNYFVWRWKEYDYTVSGINDYYRFILKMSEKGWPGGLRWLHSEEHKGRRSF